MDDQQADLPPSAKVWHERIAEYRRQIEEKWAKQRENLDKLYSRNERADIADREYSIFWANIEVLKEAAYARTPVPVVAPRFKSKSGDPIAPLKLAVSEILERCLVTTFEQSDLDALMREVRDEYLRYGRGTARARLGKTRAGVENVSYDFFSGEDFAHDPARTWGEVKWVAFRAWLSPEKGAERFDPVLEQAGLSFSQVPVKKRDSNAATVDSKEDRVPVWEIWCLTSGKVYFVNEEFDTILDTQDPWLDLTSFWPCPKPAFGTLVPRKLQPVPDIRQYKDQVEEINEYTARIAALSQALRLKGFYPAGGGEISDAIEAALKSLDDRAVLVPISTWAQFGGIAPKDLIAWIPVRDVIELIKSLVELRRVVIDDVYQITGISDIVRGDTDPNETLGAQQIKSQWGSMRIRGRQNELARFARDMARLTGEIVAENFSPETMAAMTQMEVRPEVVAMLRDDKARGFTIEIETDSTIQPDEDAEKQRRIEFVTSVGGLMKEALPVVQAAPVLAPFFGEVLKFTAQGFRAGRSLEGAIDQLVEQLNGMAQQAQQPQADPEAEAKAKEAALKLKGVEAQTQAKITGAQVDMQKAEHQLAMDQQRHAMGLERAMMPPPQKVN